MGKKLQGARLRAKKRADAAVSELQNVQAEQAVLRTTNDDHHPLFVIDTTGDHERQPKIHRNDASEATKKKRDFISTKDQQQVDALLQKHGVEKVKQMAEIGEQKNRALLQHQLLVPRLQAAQKTKTNFDLWNDDDDDKKSGNNQGSSAAAISATDTQTLQRYSGTVGSTLAGNTPPHVTFKAGAKDKLPRPAAAVAVDVAKGGQSYHPDKLLHTKLLQKAAAVEIARNKAIAKADEPISQGMSAETRALLVAEEDDSDSEMEETTIPAANKPETLVPISRNHNNKLTRAQRNKQKRARALAAMERNAKRAKKLLNEISEIPRYQKEFKQQSKSASVPKGTSTAVLGKDVEFKLAQRDPIHAPTIPVALPTELTKQQQAALRTLKPKGSLITDRVCSMADRNHCGVVLPKNHHQSDKRQRRRRKSVKGARNRDAVGSNYEVLG